MRDDRIPDPHHGIAIHDQDLLAMGRARKKIPLKQTVDRLSRYQKLVAPAVEEAASETEAPAEGETQA